jgi:hypothetical protein
MAAEIRRTHNGTGTDSASVLGYHEREDLNKKTPWPESASELYRLSDHRSSAKLVPTFADSGQRGGSLRPYSRLSRPEPLLFLSSSSSVVLTRLSGHRSRPITSQKIW